MITKTKIIVGMYMLVLISLGFVNATTLQETMGAWEQRTSMDQGFIEKGVLIDTALAMLNRSCVLDARFKTQINENVSSTLIEIGLTLNKDTAAQYYSSYQQWHQAAATYSDASQYCAYKIAAYQLQDRFYLVYKGKAAAINPVRTNYTYRIKYFDELKKMIAIYRSVDQSIFDYVNVSVANRTEVLKMHPITKKVAGQMSVLYRDVIADSLVRLQNDGILTQADVEVIGSKIVFNYVEKCSELRGLTKVVLSRNRAGKTVDSKLTSITFNVNLCEDSSYMQNFDKHIKELVYHELAHYIYYLKDTTVQDFESICRSSGKNICNRSDFVTDYAQSGPGEDYAESFQYWYQSQVINPSTAMTKKLQYFDALFEGA